MACSEWNQLNANITRKNAAVAPRISFCLLTASMMRPASGRQLTAPIWKAVIARPASMSPPPSVSMMKIGSAATMMYCDMNKKRLLPPIPRNSGVQSFSLCM